LTSCRSKLTNVAKNQEQAREQGKKMKNRNHVTWVEGGAEGFRSIGVLHATAPSTSPW